MLFIETPEFSLLFETAEQPKTESLCKIYTTLHYFTSELYQMTQLTAEQRGAFNDKREEIGSNS